MSKTVDLTGVRIGRLVALRRADRRGKKGEVYWECRCDCGKTKEVCGIALRRKNQPIRSCGCLREKLIRHEGERFGKLVVVAFAGFARNDKHLSLWKCRCDCGNEVDVIGANLRRGNSTSCGCSRLLDNKLDSKGECGRRDVLRAYKTHASKNGRSWELSDDQAAELLESNCHYCGCAPSNRLRPNKYITYYYNGIDRIDNESGYLPGNVVACCKMCNFAKRTTHYVDFIRWAKRLGRHQLSQGGRRHKGEQSHAKSHSFLSIEHPSSS